MSENSPNDIGQPAAIDAAGLSPPSSSSRSPPTLASARVGSSTRTPIEIGATSSTNTPNNQTSKAKDHPFRSCNAGVLACTQPIVVDPDFNVARHLSPIAEYTTIARHASASNEVFIVTERGGPVLRDVTNLTQRTSVPHPHFLGGTVVKMTQPCEKNLYEIMKTMAEKKQVCIAGADGNKNGMTPTAERPVMLGEATKHLEEELGSVFVRPVCTISVFGVRWIKQHANTTWIQTVIHETRTQGFRLEEGGWVTMLPPLGGDIFTFQEGLRTKGLEVHLARLPKRAAYDLKVVHPPAVDAVTLGSLVDEALALLGEHRLRMFRTARSVEPGVTTVGLIASGADHSLPEDMPRKWRFEGVGKVGFELCDVEGGERSFPLPPHIAKEVERKKADEEEKRKKVEKMKESYLKAAVQRVAFDKPAAKRSTSAAAAAAAVAAADAATTTPASISASTTPAGDSADTADVTMATGVSRKRAKPRSRVSSDDDSAMSTDGPVQPVTDNDVAVERFLALFSRATRTAFTENDRKALHIVFPQLPSSRTVEDVHRKVAGRKKPEIILHDLLTLVEDQGAKRKAANDVIPLLDLSNTAAQARWASYRQAQPTSQ